MGADQNGIVYAIQRQDIDDARREVLWDELLGLLNPIIEYEVRSTKYDDPDELLGEARLLLVKLVPKFAGGEFGAWFRRQLRFRFIDLIRASKRRVVAGGNTESEDVAERSPGRAQRIPEEREAYRIIRNRLRRQRARPLTREQRISFMRSVFHGEDYDTIARRLGGGADRKTVDNAIQQAKERVANIFGRKGI